MHYIYIYIYSSEHKDQNDIKEKSKCWNHFLALASYQENKDIKANYIIPKYKAQ